MTNERLNDIFDKTDGRCHICYKKLAFSNYGKYGQKGCWEVEHSKAQANGGTHHLNNLYAACIPCNREKKTLHTRTMRGRYGHTRAPLSKAKKEEIYAQNVIGRGVAGFFIGAIFGLPVLGATIGCITTSKPTS